jgi:hypothetical protein
VNATAQERSIGFEKNEVTAPRDGTNEMAHAWVVQRFAPTNPNDRCPMGDKLLHFFARNRRSGARMENATGVHTVNQRVFSRGTKNLRDPDLCQFCREPRW